MLFLLGEGPRLFDVLGGEALKEPLGEDRYARLFDRYHDALDELRMAVATEKDQPALRLRGGAAPEDIYRTVFTGIEVTDRYRRRRCASRATQTRPGPEQLGLGL